MAKKKKDIDADTMTDGSKEHVDEEFEANEPTPAYSQVKMDEAMYVTIKMIAAHGRMLMRDFYAEAFREFVEMRQNWREDTDGEFIYRALPKDGKAVNIAVFEEHFEEINRIANQDNVSGRTAYYNAIYCHVHKLSKEISL